MHIVWTCFSEKFSAQDLSLFSSCVAKYFKNVVKDKQQPIFFLAKENRSNIRSELASPNHFIFCRI